MLKDKCIFCGGNLKEKSLEHIFPDAIGGKLTLNCVCKHCNDLLGSRIDCLLTNEPLILYLRSKYKIPTKDKKIIDLTKEFKFFDSRGEKVFFKKGNGESMPSLYIGSKPKITIQDNRIVKFSGSDSVSIAKRLEREIDKKGLSLVDSDIQRALKTAKQSYTMESVSAPIYFNIYNFCPSILKIAYESAVYILGDRYNEDDCGCKILLFLNDLMNRRYTNNENEIVMRYQILDLKFARKEHFIQIVYNQKTDTLDAIISIFGCFIFFINISNKPANYLPLQLPFMHIETL